MTLRELDPVLIQRIDDTYSQELDHERLAEADGIRFLCPVCFVTNGGPVRTHSIICWGPNVPQTTNPKPGRWAMQGTSFDDLSLVGGSAGSSSVLLTSGCRAHFFVQGGRIVGC